MTTINPVVGGEELEYALDALESMCFQYLSYEDGPLNHMFMSAGEEACSLLCRLRPDRWRETPVGMEFIGDKY